jgi:hypothetical protein
MSYPVDRIVENSVVRNFRITAIFPPEPPKNTPDAENEQATVNPKLTVQKAGEEGEPQERREA